MKTHEIKLIVPDDVWERWKAAADVQGKSVRAYVHRLLKLPEPPRAGNPKGWLAIGDERLTAARSRGGNNRWKPEQRKTKPPAPDNQPAVSEIMQLAESLRLLREQEDGHNEQS